MAYVTYDKAKWHWGAKNAPTDIPQENGATHIAFFFRWCMERKLYSKDFAADFAGDIARMDDSFDYRQYFLGAMDGVLSSDELNAAGKAFAKAYYTTDRTAGICKIMTISSRANSAIKTSTTPIFT